MYKNLHEKNRTIIQQKKNIRDWLALKGSPSHVGGAHVYLLGTLVVGDIRFDTEGPFDVQRIFVKLEEEDDQNKEGVQHKEREDALVAQFLQIFGNSRLRGVWGAEKRAKGGGD